MRHLYVILYIILFGVSCQKEPVSDIKPFIQLKTSDGYFYSDTALAAGNQYKFGVLASSSSGENITNLIIESNGKRLFDNGYNIPELETDLIFTKTNEENEFINIIVFNKARLADTLSLNISKLEANYSTITRYSNILAGAQNTGNPGNYFSLTNGQIYTQAQAYNNQAFIDFIYYFDPSVDANTLASPGANLSGIITGPDAPENWITINTTYYSRTSLVINPDEFLSATNDSLIIENLFTNGGRKAKQLQNNQYYGFQNQNNKFGILHIQMVTGLDEGSLLFSLIIQN